jgi:DNA-binding transcriptional ArsR family regulator
MRMDEVMAALAEPLRRQILAQLRAGECSAGTLERALRVSQPTASKHLRVLREVGLVRVRKDAQRRMYALDPAPLRQLDAWLDGYRPFWTAALDGLSRHLDREV